MASNEPPTKKSKTECAGGNRSKYEVHNVKRIIEDINLCQTEIEKLNEKASEEILQVEQKYNKLRKPHFRQRNEHFKRLPRFWVTVLAHHPHVGSIIQDEEKECLKYVNDCIAEEFDDIKLGYVISLFFDENPYLENTVVTKTMHLTSSANARSETTPIKWKEGKDLIKKYSSKIASHPKKKRQPPATFFSWFLDNSSPSNDEVAETIKEDLWPSALQYYLGPAFGDKNGKLDEVDDSSDDDEEDYGEEEEGGDESDDLSDTEVRMVRRRKPEPPVDMHEDSIAEAELQGLGNDDSGDYDDEDEDSNHDEDDDQDNEKVEEVSETSQEKQEKT